MPYDIYDPLCPPWLRDIASRYVELPPRWWWKGPVPPDPDPRWLNDMAVINQIIHGVDLAATLEAAEPGRGIELIRSLATREGLQRAVSLGRGSASLPADDDPDGLPGPIKPRAIKQIAAALFTVSMSIASEEFSRAVGDVAVELAEVSRRREG